MHIYSCSKNADCTIGSLSKLTQPGTIVSQSANSDAKSGYAFLQNGH